MLRFLTAGESHGPSLVMILEGMPAGLAIDFDAITTQLRRRQSGYGRGRRMAIESDRAQALSGIRHGVTTGSPIALTIPNRDWENWKESLPVETGDLEKHKRVASPRPGHADLAGALKYDFKEARYVLEQHARHGDLHRSDGRIYAGQWRRPARHDARSLARR